MIYLSLCIPTNGISEWVLPVLDKIFEQNVNEELYEVIVTDNGDNDEFSSKMHMYLEEHSNLIYKKTKAYMFENQIEALKIANGEYLKFINHRSLLMPGTIEWMIELVKSTIKTKPVIYLSNGELHMKKRWQGDFDGFVRCLKQYASWTTGVGVWKSDFLKIPANMTYNSISPHSDILFAERNKETYIVDDRKWSTEIDLNHSKKGKYDLYKTFGCDELAITLGLYVDGDITGETFKVVKKAYQECLASFYLQFSILKKPCSYILTGFDDVMGIFYNKWVILISAYLKIPKYFATQIYEIFMKKGND